MKESEYLDPLPHDAVYRNKRGTVYNQLAGALQSAEVVKRGQATFFDDHEVTPGKTGPEKQPVPFSSLFPERCQRLTVMASHTPSAAKIKFAAQAETTGGSTPAWPKERTIALMMK